MADNVTLEVDRQAFGTTRLVATELPALTDGQVRLRVDDFAVTANNITYAAIGEMFGYWDFFPTGDVGWGRVPAMGWATAVDSAHTEVPTGSRYYGWYPMSRYVDLTAGTTAEGIRDDGAHRQAHAPVYRSYVESARDPLYPVTDNAHRADAEDRHALLRGLFLTGFLADQFFADQSYFGADVVAVLSASSKTAIGFAQRASERGVGAVVGVTSPANADFVRSLGFYTDVVIYDELDSLPVADAVLIDMSGDAATVAAIHERLAEHLRYSMIIGKSHHDAPPVPITTGPTPELFFAPTEVGRRLDEWGAEEYQRRTADALAAFVEASSQWLTVERSAGPDAAEATWRAVYDGAVPPSIGRIVSLHDRP
jgi:Protein of unknown function (DUF2855)